MAESIFETANERAEHVYERLEPHADGTADRLYLRLEEVLNELVSEAMHAIGAETANGDLDPVAQEIFGDIKRPLGEVGDAFREHVFRSTMRYLEARRRESPKVVDLLVWLARRQGGWS